uniref:Uncharacterized protein n=1 Tax=Strongyloides papillosus TaxID=174720 RepID=A0A0N5C0Q4_STREA
MKFLVLLCYLFLLVIKLKCYESVKTLIDADDQNKTPCSKGCYGMCFNKEYSRIQRKQCCNHKYCGCCDSSFHISKHSPLDEIHINSDKLVTDGNGQILEGYYVKTLSKDLVENSIEELNIIHSIKS